MKEISVASLAKEFLEATVRRCGTDESKIERIVKQVHDHSFQENFEKELYQQYSSSRSDFSCFSSQSNFPITSNNIISSLFRNELGGIELKRTEDLYLHGSDLHRGTFFERIGELFLPDLSNDDSKVLFVGLSLIHYLPSPLQSPLLFGISILSLWCGVKTFCLGFDQYFSSKNQNRNGEAIANLCGGFLISSLSLLTLGLQSRALFSSPSIFPKIRRGKMIPFPVKRGFKRADYYPLRERGFRSKPYAQKPDLRSRFYSAGYPLHQNKFSYLTLRTRRSDKVAPIASLRRGMLVLLGPLAIDFKKAVGVVSAVQPQRNNLFRLKSSFSPKVRLRGRKIEKHSILKKFYSFLDPVTGKVKSHAEILMEEFQKSFLFASTFSPFDLRMSNQKENSNGEGKKIEKKEADASFPRLVKKEDPLLLQVEKVNWAASLKSSKFLGGEEYQQRWITWGNENFTAEEILNFSHAALGPDSLFELAYQGAQRLKGEIGEKLPFYILKKIARQQGKNRSSIDHLLQDPILRNLFLKELIQIPAVRNHLLEYFLQSPVLRGELLAYKTRKILLGEHSSRKEILAEILIEQIEPMIIFSFSHLDIIAFLTFVASLEEVLFYKKYFEEVLAIVLAPYTSSTLYGEASSRSPYLYMPADLEGYYVIPSDLLRYPMLQRLNRLSGKSSLSPSVENSNNLFSNRPDLFATAFVSMFKEYHFNFTTYLRLIGGVQFLPQILSTPFKFEDPEGERVKAHFIQLFHQMREIYRILIQSRGSYHNSFLVWALYNPQDSLLDGYRNFFEINEWMHLTLPVFVNQWNIPRFPSPVQLEIVASQTRAPFVDSSFSSKMRERIQKLRKESGFLVPLLESPPLK